LIETTIYLNDHKLILNKISFMMPVENLNSAFGEQSLTFQSTEELLN